MALTEMVNGPNPNPASSGPPGAKLPHTGVVPGIATRASDPGIDLRAGYAWAPSPRLIAALAAAMFAIGAGVGAAIVPAPEPSFAEANRVPLLLSSLIARAGGAGTKTSTASTQPPASTEAATPRRRHRRKHAQLASSPTEAPSSPATETSPAPAAKSKPPSKRTKVAPLPPITKVWMIELSGSTFEEARRSSTNAPFIDTKALPAGVLAGGWSSLAASAFASDAALIATTEPQLAQTILQPPCPEGAAGAQCAAGTPGALKAADEFLAQTLPAITSTAAYRTNGLVVVSFGSIAPGAASGLPTGSTTATLSSQPPAGALLVSPFARAGTRASTTFNPISPRQSLEALLHR